MIRRGRRREEAAPDEEPFDVPGLAETPWHELRAVAPGVSAAPVPALIRQFVQGPDHARAARHLEELYRNDHGGLLAEFVHPLVPVLLEIARRGDRAVRGRALDMLADFTHGSPMHAPPGQTKVDDVADEMRLRAELRSGIDLYYEAVGDHGHTVPALELAFFVEGHSARLEEVMAGLAEGEQAVRQTVAWIQNIPSRVDEPLVVGATTTFVEGGEALPVRFGVTTEGQPRVETLMVLSLGGDAYELVASPLYVRGLARGDRFTVDASGGVSGITHTTAGVTIQVRDYDGVTPGLIDRLRRLMAKQSGDVDAHDQITVGLWLPDRSAVPALHGELERMRMAAGFEEWWVAD
jgi:hypothetical protein